MADTNTTVAPAGEPTLLTEAVNLLGKTAKINPQLDALRSEHPLPTLLHMLGLGAHAKRSCNSPLRPDTNPSWGIYQRDERWYWKDHGNGDHGDEISLLAHLNGLDEKKDFRRLLAIYQEICLRPVQSPAAISTTVEVLPTYPLMTGIQDGTADQIDQLVKDRGFNRTAIEWAIERGVLGFGEFLGRPVYVVKDQSKRVIELRRLGNELFPKYGDQQARKSHTVRGSKKSWPVGIQEAKDATMILLVEGVPDFIAAHQIILTEGARETVAPVAVLAASVSIEAAALPYFKGKHVRIVPHQDDAGFKAAYKWASQLREAGAARVDFVDLRAASNDPTVKDLCDYLPFHADGLDAERRVL